MEKTKTRELKAGPRAARVERRFYAEKDGLGVRSQSVPTWRRWIRGLWVEMRPWQWVKNLFVLAPLFFSRNLFVLDAVERAAVTFFLFCLVSSSTYLFNDLQDRELDQFHSEKRHRPLAAGELSPRVAVGAVGILLLLAVIGGGMLNVRLALILLGYWFLNVLYSLWLKQQVILDVFSIATGFVLRVEGGGVAVQVEVSHWLLLCTMLLALLLGFGKRHHELHLLGERAGAHRRVLTEYTPRFLELMISTVAASTVIAYALYTVNEETIRRFGTQGLFLTLPFVLYGVLRYLYLLLQKPYKEDPVSYLFTDPPLAINFCLWVVAVGVVVYYL
jgi:4-hydroxybenzoate polyprenyltransferase